MVLNYKSHFSARASKNTLVTVSLSGGAYYASVGKENEIWERRKRDMIVISPTFIVCVKSR